MYGFVSQLSHVLVCAPSFKISILFVRLDSKIILYDRLFFTIVDGAMSMLRKAFESKFFNSSRLFLTEFRFCSELKVQIELRYLKGDAFAASTIKTKQRK